MADDDAPEGTPDVPADADDDGGAADVANPSVSPEPVEEPVDVDETLTPYRAAKMAGIVVGTVLLCAVVVVAAVWAISAIGDDDEDESWIEYVSPAALRDYDYDYDEYRRGYGDYDEYRRGYGKGPSADADRWDWHRKDYFNKPDSWNDLRPEDDGCQMPFGFGANNRPVVIVVLPGVGPGGWGTGGGFGGEWPPGWYEAPTAEGFFGGFGPRELGGFYGGLGPELLDPESLALELFAQLFEDPSVLEGSSDTQGIEVPELHDELSLEATELDNLAPPTVEELTPT